jgi:hypothetical protein
MSTTTKPKQRKSKPSRKSHKLNAPGNVKQPSKVRKAKRSHKQAPKITVHVMSKASEAAEARQRRQEAAKARRRRKLFEADLEKMDRPGLRARLEEDEREWQQSDERTEQKAAEEFQAANADNEALTKLLANPVYQKWESKWALEWEQAQRTYEANRDKANRDKDDVNLAMLVNKRQKILLEKRQALDRCGVRWPYEEAMKTALATALASDAEADAATGGAANVQPAAAKTAPTPAIVEASEQAAERVQAAAPPAAVEAKLEPSRRRTTMTKTEQVAERHKLMDEYAATHPTARREEIFAHVDNTCPSLLLTSGGKKVGMKDAMKNYKRSHRAV